MGTIFEEAPYQAEAVLDVLEGFKLLSPNLQRRFIDEGYKLSANPHEYEVGTVELTTDEFEELE